MSQIEDIQRYLDELFAAIQDINLDGGDGAAERELEKLKERVPVTAELDPESTVEKDKRSKDVIEIAARLSHTQGLVRTLFERYNESIVLPDDFEDIFLARIDQEDSSGGGKYDEWAEVESDTETGGLKTKVGGRTHTSSGESLWESNGITGVPAGTYVLVSIEPGNNILYCFEYPGIDGKAIDADYAPLSLDKWLTVSAQVSSFTDFDARDWRGRVLHVSMYAAFGSSAGGDDPGWAETNVEHWRRDFALGGGAWQAQTADVPFRLLTGSGGATQDISRHNAADPGFNIRMNTDGHLQYQVTNATPITSVFRYHIHAGNQKLIADAEAVT